MKLVKSALLLFGLAGAGVGVAQAAPTAVIETTIGTMKFDLHQQAAPQTTARFIELAKAGWYNGKSFYRVVKGHVAQAGINDDNHPDHQKYRVPAEFSDKLPHIRGSLGMARDEDPNSGSTEFFICLERRAHLDGKYTNFGQLTDGDKVLDAFAALPVEEKWIDNPGAKPIAFHSPKQPVLIKQIRIEP